MKKTKVVFYGGLIYSDRALLYNGYLEKMANKYDIELWTQYADTYQSDFISIINVKLLGNLEKPWYLKYIRYINTYAHDIKYQSKARFYRKDKQKTSLITRFIRITGQIIFKLNLNNLSEKIVSRIHKYNVKDFYFDQLISKSRPDIVIFTWPYRASNLSLASICKRHGVKTIASVLGIDNITTKERMLNLFDHYWVWSDYMKEQLLEYYSYLNKNDIYTVGPIQYNGLLNYSTSELCNVYSEGGNRINILFCLGSPNLIQEHHVLIELLSFIKKENLEKFFLVLVRPHPGFNDNPEHIEMLKNIISKFDNFCVLQNVSHIINDEFMIQWSSAIYYANIVMACSSTILIDSIINKKKTININFSTNEINNSIIKNDVSKWIHNIDMMRYLPVKNINSIEELKEVILIEKSNQSINTMINFNTIEIKNINYLCGVDFTSKDVSKNLGTQYFIQISKSIDSLTSK